MRFVTSVVHRERAPCSRGRREHQRWTLGDVRWADSSACVERAETWLARAGEWRVRLGTTAPRIGGRESPSLARELFRLAGGNDRRPNQRPVAQNLKTPAGDEDLPGHMKDTYGSGSDGSYRSCIIGAKTDGPEGPSGESVLITSAYDASRPVARRCPEAPKRQGHGTTTTPRRAMPVPSR